MFSRNDFLNCKIVNLYVTLFSYFHSSNFIYAIKISLLIKFVIIYCEVIEIQLQKKILYELMTNKKLCTNKKYK